MKKTTAGREATGFTSDQTGSNNIVRGEGGEKHRCERGKEEFGKR